MTRCKPPILSVRALLTGSVLFGGWLLVGAAPAAPPAARIVLRDVTGETGITFRHTDGGSGRRYIMETVTAGLAIFDYDMDGDLDIYFLNGAPLRGTVMTTTPRNALYRNDGDFRFTDVTEEAGVGDTGYGQGIAVGDYDNDGAPDMYLNNYGFNVFYRNNGDGTFAEVTDLTETAGGAGRVGAGACFLDADADGDLDLFASSYIDFSYDQHKPTMRRGFHVYPGPFHYLPTPNVLYRNNGDGTFSDISAESGIGDHQGRGMGTVCADFDNDGDTDIFVANDSSANFLFENDGTGHFEEIGMLAGIGYDLQGLSQGSMAVDCADYDNDGRLDFYQTSYQDEWAVLYRNLGDGLFDDVTRQSGAGAGTRPHVTWGAGFADLDNDGDCDLFVARGHLYDNVDLFSDTTSYEVRNLVLMNTGQGTFVDVSDQCGDGLEAKFSSRGMGLDDLDGDGDIDVVILNSRKQPTILRNDSPGGCHWLRVRLVGRKTNRDGVGAQVRVETDDLRQLSEVHSGRGYEGHFGTTLHFGLGSREKVDRLEIRWIGGGTDVFRDIPGDREITVLEGTSEGG